MDHFALSVLSDELLYHTDSESASSTNLQWSSSDFRKSNSSETFGSKCSPDSTESQCSTASGQLGSWAKSGIYRHLYDERRKDIDMKTLSGQSLIECDYLSYLGQHQPTKKFNVLKLVLRDQNISSNLDSIISKYTCIEYLDLSSNKICNAHSLGKLRNLLHLDLSYNCLTETLTFKAPIYLTYVNLSHNNIVSIYDLTEFWSLVHLDLSYNQIQRIAGVESLNHLRILNLSNNNISRIENLNNMNLLELNLSYNKISSYKFEEEGLKSLKRLKTLYLQNNNLTSLKPCGGISDLRILIVEQNKIEDMIELSFLRNMNCLEEVSFIGNAIVKNKFYRDVIIDTLKGIRKLDENEISLKEKIKISQKRSSQLKAINTYLRLTHIEILNVDFLIGPHIMPCDDLPFPMVILIGPPASGNSSLCGKIQNEFAKYIYWAKLHTSAKPLKPITESNENNCINNYNLINISTEEFVCKLNKGCFLAVTELFGDSYGLSKEEFVKAIAAKKLCLIAADINLALQLKLKKLDPYIIITMPKCSVKHIKNFASKYGSIFLQYDDSTTERTKCVNFEEIKNIIDVLITHDVVNNRLCDCYHLADLNDVCKCGIVHEHCDICTKRISPIFPITEDNESLSLTNSLQDLPNAASKKSDLDFDSRSSKHVSFSGWAVSRTGTNALISKLNIFNYLNSSSDVNIIREVNETDIMKAVDPLLLLTDSVKTERNLYLREYSQLSNTFVTLIYTDDSTNSIELLKPIFHQAFCSGTKNLNMTESDLNKFKSCEKCNYVDQKSDKIIDEAKNTEEKENVCCINPTRLNPEIEELDPLLISPDCSHAFLLEEGINYTCYK